MDDDTPPDATPAAIPGLEHDHPAQHPPGPHAPEHDRPTLQPIDGLDISLAILRAQELERISASANWQAQPPGPQLCNLLMAGYYGLLQDDPSRRAQYQRRQIERLLRLHDGPTDSEMLDWVLRRWHWTRRHLREAMDALA